ncbi:MAG TPA: HYR domain-containing protein [Blastocatellia bacterium]|nr:HYR domain-containing protein [Blastocatellia bacterium]
MPTGSVPYVRRVIWVAPDGSVAQIHPLDTDPDTDDYSIPSNGAFAQVGTWTVKTIDNRGVGHAFANFSVLSATAPNADLSITKSGPALANAGDSVSYTLTITNNGPDAAQDVVIRDQVPDNTTFVSETQTAGPTATCGNQVTDGITTSVCTISSLGANAVASFTLVYTIGSGVGNGTVIFNGATVTSSTNEINSEDNQASFNTLVSSTPPPPPCTINCPSNVTVDNDANQCSAVVTYATPTTSGSCADETGNVPPVVCSPPSGSTFPTGSTPVTCASGGNACTFTVTVHDTRPPVQPTISCPGNITTDEDSAGSGSAIVNYPAPTTTGNCVNTTCFPPSGASFSVGTNPVNCSATDSSNNIVSCSFTVTVNSTSGAGCMITCPGDVTQTASAGQCSAVVNYAAPTTSGPCGTVSCAPPSGSTFNVGTTAVTCTVNGGPSCDFTVTVNASSPPTITSCAANRTLSVNADCEAAIPNMISEVHTTGCSVTVSQSPAPGTIVGPGTYAITFTAENSACDPDAVPTTCPTCTATVTVADTTPPVITSACPAPTSASANANCQAAVPNVTGGITATDNCTAPVSLTITQSPAAGTLVGAGTTTITISVKDAANNSATCTTTFTVNDTTPPTASCKNATVALDASGNASITAADVDNGSSDNCGIVSRTVSPSTFTCANKGANTVTLTVKDAANNTSTCQATVTVVDTTPPTINCQADIVVDFDPAVNGAVVTYTTPVGTDNCPGATTTQIAGLASGATFPAGTTTNTFRVTDAGGLTAQCSFKVTVAITSIIGLDSVSITGSGIVDSYDSSGGYPATKGSLANVLSNGTITVGGSSKVFGNVRSTRAGVTVSGSSQVNGNATAGTTVSVIPSGVVTGTITNNQLAPVMTLPSVPACSPFSSSSGISGTFSYNQTTGDLTLSGVNIATLANGNYCFHNVTLTNSAQLKVNGPVVIKLTGTLSASGATSINNTTAIPANLQILSSFSGSNGVTISNGTNVQLLIYAPGTNVTISGSAPVFGTVVGKTVTISNSGMIHYDVLLKNAWPGIWSLIQ